ncbi:MAG: serine protease [Bdellovibrionales bacterium]
MQIPTLVFFLISHLAGAQAPDLAIQVEEATKIRPILSQGLLSLAVDSVGTAVVVGPQVALTSCHNMSTQTLERAEVPVSFGPLIQRAELLEADSERDLCKIKIEGSALMIAPAVAQTQPQIEDVVFALGNSNGARSVSKGQILEVYQMPFGQVYKVSAWFRPGASGGALLNQNLELIGILTLMDKPQNGVFGDAYAIAISNSDLQTSTPIKMEIQKPAFWRQQFKQGTL